MPTVARIEYTGWVWNEPIRTRNSLTKELVPGNESVVGRQEHHPRGSA